MKLQRNQIIGIVGLSLFTLSLLYVFVILPIYMRYATKKQLALKQGWPMRETWSKLPFITETHMYVFNVTNHLEIGNGAKPIVQEIGPFVYDVHQEKVDLIDHEEDDTVSYIPKNLYYFNKYKSNGLSDELEVYFPHLLILTVSNGPMKYKPSLVSWTSRGVDAICNTPESVFYKMKVKTALFDGMPILCGEVDDYFGKVVCNELYERYFDYTLRKKNKTFYASMYGWLNGTYDKQKRIRIKRGIKNLKSLGTIVELDHKNNIATWEDEECDAFKGTDSSIFPPFMNTKGKDDIPIVFALACRKFNLIYHSQVKFAGLNLLRYTADVGTDGDHVPQEKCYCITPETCLRKGMFELFRCINIPVIASNPHFYKADPYYLTTVDTMTPNKDKHMLYIDFDALSGIPVRVHLRMQFNFELFPIEKFRLARNYTYSMLPVLWIDDIVILPESFIKQLKMGHLIPTLAKIISYVLMIIGLAMIGRAGYLQYKAKTSLTKSDLNPIQSNENESSNSIEIKPKILSGLHAAPVPKNLNWN